MWARCLVLLGLIGACDQVWGLHRPDEATEPPGTWRSVSVGERHSCGIRLDGTLWCWGSDELGQVGLGALDVTLPAQIGSGAWRQVAAQGSQTCAIADDRSLWCWGNNGLGQLGVGDFGVHQGLNRITGGPWERVETSRNHTCAIAADTTLWCWGDNRLGQLGNGTLISNGAPTPVAAVAPDRWRSVALGESHTCGIRDDDSLWCWGDAQYGVLADPNVPQSTPLLSPNRARGAWTKVAAGAYHTCAISKDRRMRCWGVNSSGELGDGTTSPSTLGVEVGGGADDWIDVVAGSDHNCGRREAAGLYCWGDNRYGQIPNSDVGQITSTPVPILTTVDAWTGSVALGRTHSCLIDAENRMSCVGGNSAGQLGRGSGPHFRPTKLEGEWLDVAARDAMTCALDRQRDAYCWGNSYLTAIGDGTLESRQIPTKITEPGPWDAIMAGGGASCVKRGGSRWCWGSNYGQFGIQGASEYVYLPRQIDDGHFPQTMRLHACSVSAGGLWCWGANAFGKLGLGDTTPRNLPTQLTTPPVAWALVGAGNDYTCAASSDAVYCWGFDGYHELGDGMTAEQHSPRQIMSRQIDALAVGNDAACAVSASVAWCWGHNPYGQLGTGTPIDEPLPRAITGTWRSIAMANLHACGIAVDGTLWCWGENGAGKLGDGTRMNRSTPVQIDTANDWDRVVLGREHSCALKTDRSLWCWGANGTGEVGDGTSWSRDLQRVE